MAVPDFDYSNYNLYQKKDKEMEIEEKRMKMMM